MNLTAANVREVFRDCLFTPEEVKPPADWKPTPENPQYLPTNTILIHGIRILIGFNKERVEKHREDIRLMLSELPEQFNEDSDGGWSFLNACMTKDEEHWGEHRDVEELFLLGRAVGMAKMIGLKDPNNLIIDKNDRMNWQAMPGGMPYFSINTKV